MRHQPRTALVDVLAAALLSALVLATVALSHTASNFYPRTWTESPVTWRFKNDFPVNPNPGDGTSFRARVVDGSQKWNQLDPPQRFEKLSGDVSGWGAQDCPGFMQNAVHIGSDDGPGGDLAEEFTCTFFDGSEIFLESTQIRFDQAEDWYTGVDSAVPSGRYDALGVAAHEFGHSTGFVGHFEQDDPETLCDPDISPPGSDDRQTMCQSTSTGTSEWRTFETHDRHTFDNAY